MPVLIGYAGGYMHRHAFCAKFYVTASELSELVEAKKMANASRQLAANLTPLRDEDCPKLSTRAVSISTVTGSFLTLSLARLRFKPATVA